MEEYINLFFTRTTAEDQSNYFSGISQPILTDFIGEPIELPSGTYRVIDNKLLPIISGLTIPEIKKRFDTIC